jgi:hypothetical protein
MGVTDLLHAVPYAFPSSLQRARDGILNHQQRMNVEQNGSPSSWGMAGGYLRTTS